MIYNSSIANSINDYVEEKINNNFSCNGIKYKARSLDLYAVKINYDKNYLTEEFVNDFINKDNSISPSTKSAYASFMRQLAIYMNRYNENNYVVPLKNYRRNYDFSPHIYTKEEMNRIFDALRKSYYRTVPKKQKQLYLIIKLLFSTGMRINEVLKLKKVNIDFTNNTLYIEKTKNNTDRIVVISEELMKEINEFNNEYVSNFEYLFERNYKQIYTHSLISSIFRNLLFIAKIPHNEKGPRIHDIRHTFCVNSFRQAIDRGYDLNNYIPILSTYIGHTDLKSTMKYLHLTSNYFPEIRKKVDNYINLRKEINYEDF